MPICAFLQETEDSVMIQCLLTCLNNILVEVNTVNQLDGLLARVQVEFAGGFRRVNVLKNYVDPRIKLLSLFVLQHQHNVMVRIYKGLHNVNVIPKYSHACNPREK